MPSVRWLRDSIGNALGDPHGPPMVVLHPGLNAVTAEQLAALKANPGVRAWEAAGLLEFLAEDVPQVLKRLDAHAAGLVVAECISEDTLRTWLKTEKRKPVRDTIDAQLRAIDPKSEQPEPVLPHFPVVQGEDTRIDLGHYGPEDKHSPKAKRADR